MSDVKRSAELVGRPVITIEEGLEIGRVGSLVINTGSGEIAAVAVGSSNPFLAPKVVPFALIQGVGEDAIVIENSSSLVEMSALPELAAIARSEGEVRGTKVMTRTGHFLGTVKEIIIDIDAGRIAGYEVDIAGASGVLPAGEVITIGRQVLVAAADAGDRVVHDATELPRRVESCDSAVREALTLEG
ncbi:MAG: PRC-barrel domain-containing protein [Clostridia bacterium]|nr:PRC-barrel domain-containing protein [Clostridia bacterium]